MSSLNLFRNVANICRLPSHDLRWNQVHPHLYQKCDGRQEFILRHRLRQHRWSVCHSGCVVHSRAFDQAKVWVFELRSRPKADRQQETWRPHLSVLEQYRPSTKYCNNDWPRHETWDSKCLSLVRSSSVYVMMIHGVRRSSRGLARSVQEAGASIYKIYLLQLDVEASFDYTLALLLVLMSRLPACVDRHAHIPNYHDNPALSSL